MATLTWQQQKPTDTNSLPIKRKAFVSTFFSLFCLPCEKVLASNEKMKHLSSIAIDVVDSSALKLNASVEKLVEEYEAEWKPEISGYSKKFVEFCCSKVIREECKYIEEKISDGSFSRFTFDAMRAWEMPSSQDEESRMECEGKSREERKISASIDQEQEDISLFYTDLMPLLANDEPSVGEDAFVWLGSLVPLTADVVSGRFTFETLTAPTGNRLFFPAYDKFLKEMNKCIKHLQSQAKPKGVELADDEFILHVEGTASSQRVVRHIGGTSWPGRLTITNYALYFEASRAIGYDDALKIDLSKDVEHTMKPTATGPWGAPLFDKAIIYESPELSEGIVLEFPEMTSSTRRDHWLALTKEVMLMHQFLSKYKVDCPIRSWEMHSRTILGIVRLHAAREMLRISPPAPTKFLIFALFDELPKGDYVLQELYESLKKVNTGQSCSASLVLRSLNMSRTVVSGIEFKEASKESISDQDSIHSLESAINQTREEAKETDFAKATAEGLKEEGIGETAAILMELLKPLKSIAPWFQDVISWRRPVTTFAVIGASLLIFYKEWIGKSIAAFLLWAVSQMLRARLGRVQDQCNEIVVPTGKDQKTTVENIVAAQFGLKTVHELMQATNVAILKMWSIMCSKSHKHADMTMMAMVLLAIIFAVIPLKYIIMSITLYGFIVTSKLGKYMENKQGNRRLKEWWDSIPVIPVHIEDKAS
ncbi:uncharacterized protein LOC8282370 isoform X2 [Ricinus communis]|uniref:uncharacterized protein LOC8282370 isoform X2 n=1 Tax=Ricinus communis TaxID=3988 RepID=UPI00201A689E|nr:uncharacterized protein LOC8282370 isoform X2 [Ricinus communis]